MVKIRLKRLGSKFNAFYKIVAADSRAPRDGKFIEALGHYNPHSKEFVLNEEATQRWIDNGAQPTQVVKDLFRKHKLNEKFIKNAKKNVEPKAKEDKKPKAKKATTKKTTTKKTKKTTTKDTKSTTKKSDKKTKTE